MIIGIDPGKSGAIAYLCGGVVVTENMPTIKHRVKKGKPKPKPEFDACTTRELVRSWVALGPRAVALEQVNGKPTDGGSRAFNFGKHYGQLLEMIEAAGLPLIHVPANVWRAEVGATGFGRRGVAAGVVYKDTKEISRAYATQLWPFDAAQWFTASKDGHAEAALIAEFARRKLEKCAT